MKNFLIFFGLIVYHSCLAQDPDQNNFPDRVDQYLQAQSIINNFSGAVLIAKKDSILFKGGYGIADREWNIPVDTDTKFRIGSNTKQFTAIAILQLEEHGKLNLTDKLSKFFPGFEYGDIVTIHMLLTHSSGIQDYWQLKEFRNLIPLSVSKDSLVSIMKSQLFDFLPGKDLIYSNSGYFLLGMIIEKISGQTYEDYITQNIFNVALMENTGIDNYETILQKRAKGYETSETEVVNAFDENYRIGTLFAVGSIYSTIDDLYKFDRALYENSILSEVSKQKMFYAYGFDIEKEKKNEDPANTAPQSIDPLWYHLGYGVWVDTFLTHKRIFSRGYTLGFKSTMYRFLEDNICIVVLQNNDENPDRIAEPLSAMVFGMDVVIPYKHEPCRINSEILKKYTGHWQGNIYSEKWEIEIFCTNNKLYRRIEGTPDLELIPESETKFYYSDGQDKVFEFISNERKEIKDAWFTINGIRFNLIKI